MRQYDTHILYIIANNMQFLFMKSIIIVQMYCMSIFVYSIIV
ncbi:hypothetical protein GVAMD_0546 [Gardnerella vaginalis AMD]|nr:hypothetical protein GVAMD_0546 [Gardnerella vaginalis AMD]